MRAQSDCIMEAASAGLAVGRLAGTLAQFAGSCPGMIQRLALAETEQLLRAAGLEIDTDDIGLDLLDARRSSADPVGMTRARWARRRLGGEER